MASRYFVDGGINHSYGTTSNWSDTSGGTGGFSAPGSADDVFFDANSPDCDNLVSARTCLSLDTTGYTNTITLTHTLNVQTGNCTLGSGTILAGSGALSFIGTGGTHTANGVLIPNFSITGNSTTQTLTDTFTVTGLTTLGGSTTTITVNGGAIICQGGLTCGASSGSVLGTTTITLVGTGTWTGPSTTGSLRLPVTINTAGTITFGTRIGLGGSLTYTAGTIVNTGSTFDVLIVGTTLDCAGITFNNFSLQSSVTHTLNANIYVDGLMSFGNTTANVVVNGNTIFARGGVRFAGTTGNATGTTFLHVEGPQTLDAPSRSSLGRIDLATLLDAPGGTITITDNYVGTLTSLDIVDGTTIQTDSGSFTVNDTGIIGDGGTVAGGDALSGLFFPEETAGGAVVGGITYNGIIYSNISTDGIVAGGISIIDQSYLANGGASAGGSASSFVINDPANSGGVECNGIAKTPLVLPKNLFLQSEQSSLDEESYDLSTTAGSGTLSFSIPSNTTYTEAGIFDAYVTKGRSGEYYVSLNNYLLGFNTAVQYRLLQLDPNDLSIINSSSYSTGVIAQSLYLDWTGDEGILRLSIELIDTLGGTSALGINTNSQSYLQSPPYEEIAEGGLIAGGIGQASIFIQSIITSGGSVAAGDARHGRILTEIGSGGILNGGTAPFQVYHIPAISGGIRGAGVAYIRVDYYVEAEGGLENINISQLHYQYPKPLVPEIPGRVSIGGQSICSLGHANHSCPEEGFTCLTNIPNRHKHCFQKNYYKPRPNKFRQSKSGAYVAAITVCSQGPFLPIESRAPKP